MSTILFSELEAHRLVYGNNLSSEDFEGQVRKAAEKIILLAERIKSDRLIAAMR